MEAALELGVDDALVEEEDHVLDGDGDAHCSFSETLELHYHPCHYGGGDGLGCPFDVLHDDVDLDAPHEVPC